MSLERQNDPGAEGAMSELLWRNRPEAELPIGFQSAVWHRIGSARAQKTVRSIATQIDQLVGWLLRPRFALALAIAMLTVGVVAGVAQGANSANHVARDRYLSSVNPPDFRP